MEERIEAVLQSIGLNKNERKVYIDVVQYGKSSALDISKRTKIHRTNVYDALRSLQEKSFISELVEENKRSFLAKDPEKIVDYVTQQKQEVEAILPFIKNFKKSETGEESVMMANGVSSLREALSGLFDLEQPIRIYGASKEAVNIFGEGFLDDFHKKRIKKKITMHHIYHQYNPERVAKMKKMSYTYAKHLPKRYESLVSTAVCGDTVLLFVFSRPPSLIKIKNKKIADVYSSYFDALWEGSS